MTGTILHWPARHTRTMHGRPGPERRPALRYQTRNGWQYNVTTVYGPSVSDAATTSYPTLDRAIEVARWLLDLETDLVPMVTIERVPTEPVEDDDDLYLDEGPGAFYLRAAREFPELTR